MKHEQLFKAASFYIYATLFLTYASIYGDTITVSNTIPRDVYVGIYYQNTEEAQLVNGPLLINKESSININRPDRKSGYDRVLMASFSKTDFKQLFTAADFKLMTRVPVGYLNLSSFYIAMSGYKLKAYTLAQWKIYNPIGSKVSDLSTMFFDQFRDSIRQKNEAKNYLHKGEKANVRPGPWLATQESAYLTKRLPFIKKAQEQLLNEKLEDGEVVRIAFCSSGGGYRALVGTLGFLMGAEKEKLLDCVTYAAGLSGSTWLLAPWLESSLGLEAFKDALKPCMHRDFFAGINFSEMQQTLLLKWAYKKPISMVDIYGCVLNQKLLSCLKVRDDQALSYQAQRLDKGHIMFPIYTALLTQDPDVWFEFTPYEVGSTYLNSYIPTWAFNRKFDKGSSVESVPPENLSFLMGIWGSAFSGNAQELLVQFDADLQEPLRSIVAHAAYSYEFGRSRLVYAKINNFTLGMSSTPLYKKKTLGFIDPGLRLNLPFPPLYRKERKIDIIIALDSSTGKTNALAVRNMEQYARKYNIPFPKPDYSKVGFEMCSVIGKPGTDSPIIIYMPLIKNDASYFGFDPQDMKKNKYLLTQNSIYTGEQIEQLSGLTKANMTSSMPIITQVIREVMKAKRATKATSS